MQRLPEHRFDIANFRKRAGVHNAETIDDLSHQPHVVAHQDDRSSQLLLHALQGFDHLALDNNVKRAGRFVGYDHLRAETYRDGDHYALFHSATQLVRVPVGDIRGQADMLKELADVRLHPRVDCSP